MGLCTESRFRVHRISGAFAYDNLFLMNGVDINDNVLGTPNNLLIEDAVQEVQGLTSGISAEHGRFSGGSRATRWSTSA